MNKIKSLAIKLWRDESGQGTAEYVLILVGVVVVASLFRERIQTIVKNAMGDQGVAGKISKFMGGST